MTSLNHKCNLHRQQAVNPQPSDKPALPDFYMPAMPPLGLINAIEVWFKAWNRRRKLLRLLDYDDHMLEDMGYTRDDLLWAARQPLKVDARLVLQQQREKQRAQLKIHRGW
ncbi:MAG: hypothetical protein ACK4L8_03345 [Nitrincola lacisaponensis]|uniref:hypothetical protein n=1 Tax=Nitrincola lacisaponensis TaxID=267850 RepID=UPI0039189770